MVERIHTKFHKNRKSCRKFRIWGLWGARGGAEDNFNGAYFTPRMLENTPTKFHKNRLRHREIKFWGSQFIKNNRTTAGYPCLKT